MKNDLISERPCDRPAIDALGGRGQRKIFAIDRFFNFGPVKSFPFFVLLFTPFFAARFFKKREHWGGGESGGAEI